MSSHARKIAIVTGASKGFGKAVSEALVAAGWGVVGDARDAAVLKTSAEELGPSFQPVAGDITDPAHLASLVTIATEQGNLRLVVNNAGSLGPTPLPSLASLAVEDLQSLFATNVAAPLQLIQLALPLLRVNGGTIINVTSDAVPQHYEGWGAYGASKAALEKISGVVATEVPEVRVYELDPGDMRTDMQQAAFPGEDISDRPEPVLSAPAVLRLVDSDAPSGRYKAVDLINPGL